MFLKFSIKGYNKMLLLIKPVKAIIDTNLCVSKLTWSSIWAMEQSENLKLYSLVLEFIIADEGAMM